MERISNTINKYNPDAGVLEAPSIFKLENRGLVENKRVLIIEDGPTITHGGMAHGAGVAASFDSDRIADLDDVTSLPPRVLPKVR